MAEKKINLGDFKAPQSKEVLIKSSGTALKKQKKKPIGRPPQETTANMIIKGYFTKEERENFEEAARKDGRNMSSFLRYVLQKHKYI